MGEPELKVVARDVSYVTGSLAEFKADQSKKWGENRETHQDLYDKLDRLPAWATLLIAFLSAVAAGAVVAAVKAF